MVLTSLHSFSINCALVSFLRLYLFVNVGLILLAALQVSKKRRASSSIAVSSASEHSDLLVEAACPLPIFRFFAQRLPYPQYSQVHITIARIPSFHQKSFTDEHIRVQKSDTSIAICGDCVAPQVTWKIDSATVSLANNTTPQSPTVFTTSSFFAWEDDEDDAADKPWQLTIDLSDQLAEHGQMVDPSVHVRNKLVNGYMCLLVATRARPVHEELLLLDE